MGEIYPSYCENFQCIASACRHNCCIGWEIDIDERSAARYARLPGALGETVRGAMIKDDALHFRLDEKGRCALLRSDNLCTLQHELGEGALCDICRDHPRWRVFLPGRTEVGLGLCCEEASRLLLSCTDKVTLRGEVTKTPPRETRELLLFRQKLLDAAQDRTLPVGGRMRKILALAGAGVPRKPRREWAAFFSSLEALEDEWGKTLELLNGNIDYVKFHSVSRAWETEYEQLLVYFLLRHLLADEGREMPQRAAFAVLSTSMLYALDAAVYINSGKLPFGQRVELARLWSANVEYSEDNMRAVLSELT